MEEYSEGFIENGYDDLETVKLIEREDLIAIGVNRSDHQVAVMRKYKVVFYLKHFQTFLSSSMLTNQQSKLKRTSEHSNVIINWK